MNPSIFSYVCVCDDRSSSGMEDIETAVDWVDLWNHGVDRKCCRRQGNKPRAALSFLGSAHELTKRPLSPLHLRPPHFSHVVDVAHLDRTFHQLPPYPFRPNCRSLGFSRSLFHTPLTSTSLGRVWSSSWSPNTGLKTQCEGKDSDNVCADMGQLVPAGWELGRCGGAGDVRAP